MRSFDQLVGLIPSIREIIASWDRKQMMELLKEVRIYQQTILVQIPIQIMVLTHDREVKKEALKLIRNAVDQSLQGNLFISRPAYNAVCEIWAETRDYDLEKIVFEKNYNPTSTIIVQVLVALKTNHPERITELRHWEIAALVQASQDDDIEIMRRARAFLRALEGQALEYVAKEWAEHRFPFLLEILEEKQYVPEKPIEAKVKLGLKLGNWEQLKFGRTNIVPHLIKATQDTDKIIATKAEELLRKLKDKKSQHELCRMVVEHDLPTAQAAALEAGYLPELEHEKALFYFVTEQWQKYEGVDFDYRYLRAAYEAADPPLRRRLAGKVRVAGKTEYLTALAGLDFRSRTREVNLEEAEVLVQILTSNREWEKLWTLVFELPLEWSVEAVRAIGKSGWQPTNAEEKTLLAKLKSLATRKIVVTEDEANRILPPALLRAKARVPGRVNAVSFSYTQPIIAIGTGTGKVVLWDMQEGVNKQIISGFKHSIGKLCFTSVERLVIAERTNSSDNCGLYVWDGTQLILAGENPGTFTALEVSGDDTVLVSGGNTVRQWDVLNTQQQTLLVLQRSYYYGDTSYQKVRVICFSPDKKWLALVSNETYLLELANFSHKSTSIKPPNVPQCATFSPDGQELLLGQSSGRLQVFPFDEKGKFANETIKGSKRQVRHELELENWASSAVQGLATMPEADLVLVATINGNIQFIEWTNKTVVGKVTAPGEKLTSVTVSPDGHFMAVGDSDASFTLWDLRILELRRLFRLPLARGRSVHMIALDMVKDSPVDLPREMVAALDYIETTLRHRFRYDVELVEEPFIHTGEFDIEF